MRVPILLALFALPASSQLTGEDTFVADLLPVASGAPPTPQVLIGDQLLLTNKGSIWAEFLWISDGTAAGTTELRAFPGFDDAPGNFSRLGGRALFSAGDELWITDGTVAGTEAVLDFNSFGSAVTWVRWSASLGETAVFSVDTVDGNRLYRTDGTEAGTVEIASLYSSLNGYAVNGTVWFSGNDDSGIGWELWKTDGTAAGTGLVKDINPAGDSGAYLYHPLTDGRVLFNPTGPNGRELWVTDGTDVGTRELKDLFPGATGSGPGGFASLGDLVAFTALTPEGFELWSTDGTDAGTTLIKEWIPGPDSGLVAGCFQAGDVAWVYAQTSLAGPHEMWTTDGTAAGTTYVADRSSDFQSFDAFGLSDGRLLYRDRSDASGWELWLSDGSAAGTQLLAEINPGSADSFPTQFTRAGVNVFFTADDGIVGDELHAVTIAETGGWVLERYDQGCGVGAEAPTSTWSGTPTLGDSLALGVDGGAPASPAFLFLSSEPVSIPLGGGCAGLIQDPLYVGAYATDGAGTGLTLPVPIPDVAVLAGVPFYFQSAIATPGGPFAGLELSDGLEVVLGP